MMITQYVVSIITKPVYRYALVALVHCVTFMVDLLFLGLTSVGILENKISSSSQHPNQTFVILKLYSVFAFLSTSLLDEIFFFVSKQ